MPFHLLSLSDGPSVRLDQPIVLVGRAEECDVILDGKKVSRLHCCLAEVDGRLLVRDLGSTNGVRVNGAKVAEATLDPGDELHVGEFRYQVCGDVLGRSDDHLPLGGERGA